MNLGEIFFLKKGLDLELFHENFVTRTFSGFFHIDEYFGMQEQFSIQKFPIRYVLDIEFLARFCGLMMILSKRILNRS
jgi:hypothetical protein